MTQIEEPLAETQRNPVLADAWQRFADYDHNSMIAQKRYFRLRRIILILSVTATFLAVVYSILKPIEIPWVVQVNNPLRYIVILTPIAVATLQTGAAKFKGGTNYILFRGSAEAVKREIYRYRSKAEIYSPEETESESREIKLARKVKSISGQLMKTEANQAGYKQYKGKLPPKYGAHDDDDGFSDLDPENYITWRLDDQLKFYRSRTAKFDKQLRLFQWSIFIFGGLGTFLAAIGLEIWIAVTIAMAGAFASYLELQQVEATMIAYNQASTDLGGIRIWWHALSDEDKSVQDNKDRLVEYTEMVLKTELIGWVQEMQDALADLYAEAGESSESTGS